jgi:hypothetical protein
MRTYSRNAGVALLTSFLGVVLVSAFVLSDAYGARVITGGKKQAKQYQVVQINVTKCWARHNGKIYVIANGQTSAQRCHELAKRCTGNPNVTSHYNTNPITVLEDFEYCDIASIPGEELDESSRLVLVFGN